MQVFYNVPFKLVNIMVMFIFRNTTQTVVHSKVMGKNFVVQTMLELDAHHHLVFILDFSQTVHSNLSQIKK